MMLHPSIDKLLEQVDSKYSMVILSSKRAHQLHGRSEPLLDHLPVIQECWTCAGRSSCRRVGNRSEIHHP